MATVTPLTHLNFCAGVPLDNRYVNTLWFEDRATQMAYFMGRRVAQVGGCTYQRQGAAMRVELPISQLMHCNYVFFRNEEFDDRTFFAFITGVEYINNNVTAVKFEIDVMQTYFLDCTFRQCFIERGHTGTDNIGENLIPEDLETGDYINISQTPASALQTLVICIASSVDENGNDVRGGWYAGVYSGVKIFTFQTATEADAFINTLTELGKSDAIVNIFMMPHTFQVGLDATPKENTFNIQKPYGSINGYVPQNKKLFTYPYNCLYITNLEGQAAEFHYEYFSTSDCGFSVWGAMSGTPDAVCIPKKYKGVDNNFDERLTLTGWAQCAFTIDSYKAWMAQNANMLAWQDRTSEQSLVNSSYATRRAQENAVVDIVSTIGNVIDAATPSVGFKNGQLQVGTPSVGSMISTAAGAAGSVMGAYHAFTDEANIRAANTQLQIDGIVAQRMDHAIMPPQAHGSSASSVMQGLKMKTFVIYQKQIRADFAKIIDDYFTLYGYAIHRIHRPNFNVRSRYTFTKTKGCNAQGNAPVWAIKTINDLMDKGLTFWHDHSGVGNYELPNPPIGGGEY